jgi:hypothetical protein
MTVLLFPDADLDAAASAARAAGAEVLASAKRVNRVLRVRTDLAGAQALARDPDVAWVEPWSPAHTLNDQVQGIVQTGVVGNRRLWDLGLHGEGQVVMTSDTGLNVNHNAFRDPLVPITGFGNYPGHRKVIAYLPGAPDSAIAFGDQDEYHGTHTAGTAVGNDDPLGSSARDGVAKGAKLWFEDMSGPTFAHDIVTPADLNDLFQPAYFGNSGGAARIASNSWGAAIGGVYSIDCFTVDQFMWTHPDFLVVFANGNSGGMGTVASPAAAKDVMSVGATGNGAAQQDFLAGYSSRGPTTDLRRKPTLCAPGGVSGGSGVFSSTTDTATYQTSIGTSMASPAAAGTAALIRQYLTEGWYPTGAKVAANAITPSAALLKAMCINSATNLVSNFTAPDNNVGWGRIDADSVLYFAGDSRRLWLVDQKQGLDHGEAIEYQLDVTNSAEPLEVSLCWTDAPGLPSASHQLVNDLDLIVTNGATTYHRQRVLARSLGDRRQPRRRERRGGRAHRHAGGGTLDRARRGPRRAARAAAVRPRRHGPHRRRRGRARARSCDVRRHVQRDDPAHRRERRRLGERVDRLQLRAGRRGRARHGHGRRAHRHDPSHPVRERHG